MPEYPVHSELRLFPLQHTGLLMNATFPDKHKVVKKHNTTECLNKLLMNQEHYTDIKNDSYKKYSSC